MSTRLGLRGWPHAAEDLIVSRDVILSAYTGAHIHLQHISSQYSVEIIRQAKAKGLRITAEATPHHLALTESALSGYDPNFKMNPPLRTEADRQALIAGLRDGTLDCVATDHAPHPDYEKDREFDFGPNGILGLETALPWSSGCWCAKPSSSCPRSSICSPAGRPSCSASPPGPSARGRRRTSAFSTRRRAGATMPAPEEQIAQFALGRKELHRRVNPTLVDGRVVFDGLRIV